MEKRSKPNKNNQTTTDFLNRARFSPKFEETTGEYRDDHKKGSKETTVVYLTGLLSLFSNPLLH